MAMKQFLLVIVLGVLITSGSDVLAGDAAAGKAKSGTCAGCHGAAGISKNPMWPNLAGQPMMTPMAKPLTDEDIANLAAWYNSL
jgi:cytochrome c553